MSRPTSVLKSLNQNRTKEDETKEEEEEEEEEEESIFLPIIAIVERGDEMKEGSYAVLLSRSCGKGGVPSCTTTEILSMLLRRTRYVALLSHSYGKGGVPSSYCAVAIVDLNKTLC
ncbi:hypothetical protein L1049_015972 [Liquidambar formosana]|uniref:Uncharacterized protein n=1 Tax=Liquidambar formosana TaxID=63359 RepID=A0AAP0S4H2_LIQFO